MRSSNAPNEWMAQNQPKQEATKQQQQHNNKKEESKRRKGRRARRITFCLLHYCSLIPPEPTFELEGTKSTIDNIIDSYYKLYKMTVVIDSQQPINAVHIDGLVSPKL